MARRTGEPGSARGIVQLVNRTSLIELFCIFWSECDEQTILFLSHRAITSNANIYGDSEVCANKFAMQICRLDMSEAGQLWPVSAYR